jgi:two-component system response regulator NreC
VPAPAVPIRRHEPQHRSNGGGSGPLTKREVEVLRLLALGHTNPEIASTLVVSVRTVEAHRAHIQHKLGCSGRAALVRYALHHELVEW